MQPVLKRYLEKIIKDNRTIDARGVMQVNRMIELTLDEVFINLTSRTKKISNTDAEHANSSKEDQSVSSAVGDLTTDPLSEDYPDTSATTDSPDQPMPTIDIWQNYNAWVILGEPGAGKTTLLNYFALKNAESCETGNGYLPIILPLRLFASEWEKQPMWLPQDAVMNYLENSGLSETGFEQKQERDELLEIFRQAFDKGRALLLFDGLDEQRNVTMQRKTVAAIEDMYQSYPGNRFLVSSRIIGYDAAPLGIGFNTATLEPFNDDQMSAFFHQWIYAVEKQEDIVIDQGTMRRANEKADQLVKQINTNAGIRALATNPLLCTIIGLIRRQGATLPQLRAELYKLCIDTFIFNWELQKRRRDDQQGSLNKNQTQAVLEELALHFHEHCPVNRAPQQIIAAVIRDFLVKEEGISAAVATRRAEQLLSLILEITGLLINRGNNEYGFFHLIFQEYLAARAITRRKRDIDRYLMQYMFKPRWREVILLAAAHQGMKDEETGSEFIEAILRCKHLREAQMHYAFRIAFLCLKEARVLLDTSDKMLREWIQLYLNRTEMQDLLLTLMVQPGGIIRHRAETLQPLIIALNDKDSQMRTRAAAALGNIQDPLSLPALSDALKDKDDNVRRSAITALSQIKAPAAVPTLLDALKDADANARRSAALALGYFKDPAIQPALQVALNDNDGFVAKYAAIAMGRIKAPASFNVLLTAFKNGIGNGGPLIALHMFRDADSMHTLRNALKNEANNPHILYIATTILGECRDLASVPNLLDVLKNRDIDINFRSRAAAALGLIKEPASIPELLIALVDEDYCLRNIAASTLGQIGNPSTLPALTNSLRDVNSSVRSSAALALGKIKEPSSVPYLLEVLKDEDSIVRGSAVLALGQIKDPSSVPHLLAVLKDEDRDVVRRAFQALYQIKDTTSLPTLLNALTDEKRDVRRDAAENLRYIEDTAFLTDLLPALLPALKDSDIEVRRAVSSTLGQIKNSVSMAGLQEALKDVDIVVRCAAVAALGQIRDPESVPDLERALNDENSNVRGSAALALGQIRDPSSLAALLNALNDAELNVRVAAFKAIERIDLGTSLCPD